MSAGCWLSLGDHNRLIFSVAWCFWFIVVYLISLRRGLEQKLSLEIAWTEFAIIDLDFDNIDFSNKFSNEVHVEHLFWGGHPGWLR